MVKTLVWLAMGGMLVGGMLWGMQVMNSDPGLLLGTAVTAPDANGKCEFQVVVPKLMAIGDGPPMTASFKPDWDAWLDQHFNLRDASGNRAAFRKGGFKTQKITEAQSGACEFIAHAEIDAGKTYTYTVTPVVGEPEKYTMTLESNEQNFRRVNLDPDY